jgi:hypothetical protein
MSIAAAFALPGVNAATLRPFVAAGAANARTFGTNPPPAGITSERDAAMARTNSPALSPAYIPAGPNGDGRACATNPYTRLTNEMVQQLVARFDLTDRAHVVRFDQRASPMLLNRLA